MSYAEELRAVGIDVPYGAHGQISTTCPKCSASRSKRNVKCLSVNVDEGVWNCHHCGDSGGVGNPRDGYGAPLPPKVYARPDFTPDEAPKRGALDYLEHERGIPRAVIERNRISLRRVWFPQLNAEAPAIAFPYYRSGEIVNVKYRAKQKLFRMEKDAELILYGLDDIGDADCLVWVEGEIDKLSVEAAGIRACVSVPNGGTINVNRAIKLDYVDSAIELLDTVPRHIIATDADAVGKALGDEIIRRVGPEKCERVQWPEGCKDANEVLLAHGAAKIRECIELARPVPIPDITRVFDQWEEVADLWHNGLRPGLNPGSDALAELYNVSEGQMTIVTGIPNHGKSALLDWMLVSIARRYDWRFAIFSPENTPQSKHIARLTTLYTGQPFRQGIHERMTLDEVAAAQPWLHEHFVFVRPEGEPTIDTLLEVLRRAVRRLGVKGAVIDPWNEIEYPTDVRQSETQYIGTALLKLVHFARSERVHLWIVAHPTKMRKGDDNTYPVPTLYDISGSANFRNRADMGFVVHRPDLETNETQVHVQKVRSQPENGRPGLVTLYRDPLTGRYYDKRAWNNGQPKEPTFEHMPF